MCGGAVGRLHESLLANLGGRREERLLGHDTRILGGGGGGGLGELRRLE